MRSKVLVIPASDLAILSECEECPDLGEGHVPGYGSPYAELMIIGQSPGIDEVKTREPFTGPAGKLVRNFLDELLLLRDEVYITNLVKCHPLDNRPSAEEEKQTCRKKWLNDEIKLVQPCVILMLGREAHESIMPEKHSFKNKLVVRTRKRSYITLYHPAYWLRKKNWASFLDGTTVVREELDYWRMK